MMDAQIRRIYFTAAGIALAATAVSLAWKDPRITAGVASGVAVSVVPLVTWHLIVGHASEKSAQSRARVMVLVMLKYVVLTAMIWALFRFRLVNEYGFGAGLVAGSMAVLGSITVRRNT
jgi:hypothetical protein